MGSQLADGPELCPEECVGGGARRVYPALQTLAHASMNVIGVRDLVARGYFIPGGASQRGGGQAPAFRVARCQTWTQVSHPRCPSTQDFGNRTVTFRIDHNPCTESRYNLNGHSRLASYNKTKNESFWRACWVFALKKCVPSNAARGL